MTSIDGVDFTEAPGEVEGSPYWVDLWGCVNGYRIGMQVKPDSFRSASVSVYQGKARSGMRRGHYKFQSDYGGKVFTTNLTRGEPPEYMVRAISEEIVRLRNLPSGDHC
mgnify:CR=1 FL=1